jgi:hypothetical protein
VKSWVSSFSLQFIKDHTHGSRDGCLHVGCKALVKRYNVRGLNSNQSDVFVGRQLSACSSTEVESRAQIGIMGRGAVLGWDSIRPQTLDGTWPGPAANGIDNDGPVEADQALHQPQPPSIVLIDLDIRPTPEQWLEPAGNVQPDGIIPKKRVPQADNECLHAKGGSRSRGAARPPFG